MTFDELWEEIWRNVQLPSAAKDLLPQSLSNATKRKILHSNIKSSQIASLIEEAVDAIDHGSIESIDQLVLRQLTILDRKQ